MKPRPDPLKGKTKLNQGEKGEDLTKSSQKLERGQITADTAETQSTEELTSLLQATLPASETDNRDGHTSGTTSQDRPGRNRKCENGFITSNDTESVI